jgi:hypothetical protein
MEKTASLEQKKQTRIYLKLLNGALADVTVEGDVRVGELNPIKVERVMRGSISDVPEKAYKIGEPSRETGFVAYVYHEIE